MEKYVAVLGAIGLIFFTLVVVSLMANFFIKGFYVYAFKVALTDDRDSKAKPKPFELLDLLSECEEQKVWLCMVWQRPVATLVALTAGAFAVRMNMGMSASLGTGTLVFLVAGFLLPMVAPSLPTFRLFSKTSTQPAASPASAP